MCENKSDFFDPNMSVDQILQRDDVAKALATLLDREDAASLAIDIVTGDSPVEEALDSVIKNRVNAYTDL